MTRLVTTISIGLFCVALVWLSGHFLFADWYQQKYDRLLAPAVNFAAMPALITILICGVVEYIMRKFSADNAPHIVLVIFGIRMASMLLTTIVVFMLLLERSYTTAFLIWIVLYYWAVIIAHVISHTLDIAMQNKNLQNEKVNTKIADEQINNDLNDINEQY